jgi:dihydroorotase
MELSAIIHKMTIAPREILGIETPKIEESQPARFTLISTAENSQWNKKEWASKSINSPFIGETLRGKVIATLIQ